MPRNPGLFLALAGTCLLPALLPAADAGAKAHYVGGTATVVSTKAEGRLLTTQPDTFVFQTKDAWIGVPYKKIQLIEYGQRVNRRYVSALLVSPMMLLAKKRRHYLTVAYLDERGERQALVFEVAKNGIRGVLASLEAKSGLRVEYQDDEARKAG
ncbi:MAG: hypothetical protein ACRD96_02320 [Bryobacteraceae bacterium]